MKIVSLLFIFSTEQLFAGSVVLDLEFTGTGQGYVCLDPPKGVCDAEHRLTEGRNAVVLGNKSRIMARAMRGSVFSSWGKGCRESYGTTVCFVNEDSGQDNDGLQIEAQFSKLWARPSRKRS